MAATKEVLLDWLRDAYAMEQMAIEILEKQAQRTESYPQLQSRVSQHVEETKWQADQVKQCIQELGGDTSSIKSGMAKFVGNLGAITNAGAPDEVVKNTIGDYAVENFEIASYRSLIGAAEELGMQSIKQVCQQILQQEEAMASWLEQQLPMVTQQYLTKREADLPAKR